MSEALLTLNPDVEQQDQQVKIKVGEAAGKISILEALAEPAPEDITPSMSWQSAWSNKEDR